MRKSKFLICMLLVLALVIAIPAAILANDTPSDTGNVPEYGGNIYNAGNVNISGGTVYGGVAHYGGNLFNAKTGNLTVSTGATILDGVAYVLGGNVYATNGSAFNNKGGQFANSGSNYDGIYAPNHTTCICGSKTATHATGCDGDKMAIDWQEWTDPTALPTEPGYYYLTGNVYAKDTTTLTGNGDYYLDLNGKTIYSQVGFVYNVNSSTTNSLTILDSNGNGVVQLGSSTTVGAFARVAKNNVLTIYGGTINGEKVRTTSTAGAIIALGANNEGGTLNIHGGTIIGGTATGAKGSGTISVNSGTLNITGGEIRGGRSALGGNIYVYAGATANISGDDTNIHSGIATADGYSDAGNVYAEEGATLNISDDVVISDSLMQQTSTLQVGYGKAAITPTTAVMTGENKPVTVDKDHIYPIYAISVYMKDNMGHEYLHVVTDLSWGGLKDNPEGDDGIADQVRAIAAEMGFDSKYVTVAGIHTHTGVVYGSDDAITRAWRQNELRNGVIASINAAVADAAPADVYTGSTKTDGLTFVRRYTTAVNSNYPNGYYDGFNQTTTNKPSDLKNESAADEQIQLIKFTRTGKKDVLMVNWQTHATMADGNAIISSDFVGALRDKLDAELNVQSVYYQGACGDQAPISRIDGVSKFDDGYQSEADALGRAVADCVIAYNKTTNAYEQAAVGAIQIHQEKISSKSSKVTDPTILENAQSVLNYLAGLTGETSARLHATNRYALTKGFESYYHAKAIIDHKGIPENKTYEMNTITIGDVAFITLPMEVSHKIGLELKNNSKFQTTMLLGYACGTGEYLMEEAAYENGGYETYNTYFVKGTAEQFRDLYLDQLDEFYASRY